MARTVKARREAYDNIAVGSAITSRERTIAGASPPDFTVWGNTENIQVATDYGPELIIEKTTALSLRDNVKVGG